MRNPDRTEIYETDQWYVCHGAGHIPGEIGDGCHGDGHHQGETIITQGHGHHHRGTGHRDRSQQHLIY